MNILNTSSDEMVKILRSTSDELKDMAGDIPFGMRKATRSEQKQMYDNLTPEILTNMINKYGREQTNQFLKRFRNG